MKLIRLLTLVVPFLLGGCRSSAPELTPQEQQHVQTMTHQMTPRCVGRFLIDLPADMVLGFDPVTTIEGAQITVRPMGRVPFTQMLAEREAELRAGRLHSDPHEATLASVNALPNQEGKVFDRSENGSSNVSRIIELHAWQEGYHVEISTDAVNMEYASEEQKKIMRSNKTNVQERQTQLLNLYSRFTIRKDTALPSGPGVCIPHGFIRGAATDEENVSHSFVFRSMPDVTLTVTSLSGVSEETTLLERGDAAEKALAAAQARTVRKGKREAHGIQFEEWLMSLVTEEGIPGHYFVAEANSKTGSAKTPLVMLDFYNGNRDRPDNLEELPPLKKASLTEAEAVALWDRITQTLRPRPGAF